MHEAQSELLARTTPTLWDVLIAFFGGLAGIVAGSRREKTNAIPGVAIATALMPPLCTAGYGLANGNFYYFIGALYLFFINSVFISVSTFLIVRFLKYPKIQFESRKAEKRIKSYILIFVIITAIPSIYLAYNVVKRTIFEQNARNFVSTEFFLPETQVISQVYKLDGNEGLIDLTLYGKKIDDEDIDIIKSKMPSYNLQSCELIVRQGYQEDFATATALEFQRMSEDLKVGILEDLYRKNEDALQSREDRIRFLEKQLLKVQQKTYPVNDMSSELKVQYPSFQSMSICDMITNSNDTLSHAILRFSPPIYRKDKKKVSEWLKVRSKADTLIVIFQ